MTTIDEIWADDLLNRKSEAAALIGYIESIVSRPRLSQEDHAHVLAVDAGYGQGKTFFLQKLAEQLALNHPVAYVDAWRDDLEDQPLTAISATLEDALMPFIKQLPELDKSMNDLRAKAGDVLKIAAGGALRRLIGLAITQVAADELLDALSNDRVSKDFIDEAAKKAGEDIPDKVFLGLASDQALMSSRIEAFRKGRSAIEDMKKSLGNLVRSLDCKNKYSPIIIIIDELDRCRPTYAIKLLEEVKHLFDAKGVVFVLGMHGDQLAHSIAKAYGANFAAKDYLRRFIHRRYTLKTATLSEMVDKAIADLSIDVKRLHWPLLVTKDLPANRVVQLPVNEAISIYLKAFGIAPRDAYRVFEIFHISLALTENSRLDIGLLMPLICGFILGSKDDIPNSIIPQKIVILNEIKNDFDWFSVEDYARNVLNYAGIDDRRLLQQMKDGYDPIAQWVYHLRQDAKSSNQPLADPGNYRELISTVARFDSD